MTLNGTTLFKSIGIISLHVVVVAALVSGPSPADWLVFALIYPWAAIGVGVSMHRYFAHHAFRTSRAFQLVLAVMAALAFGNAVYFAGKHRLHHRYSDQQGDVHSPDQGFLQCWFGSLVDCGYSPEKIRERVQDHLKYPELDWMFKNALAIPLALNLVLFLAGGFTMMAIGGCLSAVILLHQSSAVNYLCHCRGYRSFETTDNSRNNPVVALLTFGEGWHNNHHRFQNSAQSGMRWWEIDMFHWVICLFEALGLIWDVKRVRFSRGPDYSLLLDATRGK